MTQLPDPTTQAGMTDSTLILASGPPQQPASNADYKPALTDGLITTSSTQKELEPRSMTKPQETASLTELGKDMELPKEVIQAGVTIHPTTIVMPAPLIKAGVMPVGHPMQSSSSATTIVLPLTDDQIAQGLTISVENSWRWLSEWCMKRLKKLHMTIKNIGGKGKRVRV